MWLELFKYTKVTMKIFLTELLLQFVFQFRVELEHSENSGFRLLRLIVSIISIPQLLGLGQNGFLSRLCIA